VGGDTVRSPGPVVVTLSDRRRTRAATFPVGVARERATRSGSRAASGAPRRASPGSGICVGSGGRSRPSLSAPRSAKRASRTR
jgi:hypothetical protein